MFSPQFMNYIIDPTSEEENSSKTLHIENDEKITNEVDLLKNQAGDFINQVSLALKGIKNKLTNKA
ncbi:MAG: hypothetical protein WCK67_00210 [bacterium]